MSSRGRKRNDNLPPSRAREVQRAFRAQCPPQTNACSPPSDRQPLGRGPTGREPPRRGQPDAATGTAPFRSQYACGLSSPPLSPGAQHGRSPSAGAWPPPMQPSEWPPNPQHHPPPPPGPGGVRPPSPYGHLGTYPPPGHAQNQGTEVLRSIIERDQGPIPTFAFNVPKQQSSILPNPADRAPTETNERSFFSQSRLFLSAFKPCVPFERPLARWYILFKGPFGATVYTTASAFSYPQFRTTSIPLNVVPKPTL
ncbi:hypothetical protein RHS01_06055 [Rhizoctonia solani]|uniref:Uncharacterized protein n=1 Tax=Rhizoctonia solani TaxID=456999 RepID=A0A8H7IAF8_9AGAM|nr:hypothetical protein RHS01_06055 [Rhizoctonia solani]